MSLIASTLDIPLTLKVVSSSGEAIFSVPVGTSVRDALDLTDLRVRAACGGSGSCGACAVTWVSGEVTAPTVAEYMKLPPAERLAGARLACQMRLLGNAVVRIDDPAPPSQWKSIAPENLIAEPAGCPSLQHNIYGVAVDLGTTHIRVTLWDRRHGRRIASRRGPNPQGAYGADVLNRLAEALKHPDRAAGLAKLARTAIVQAVRDILKRDVGEVAPMLAEIGEVCIVGNTAMLALLSGRGAAALLDPEHWARRIDCQPADPAAFHDEWFMPHASIHLVDPVAGFIGSDLLAGVLATGLTEGPAGSLLVDVGTNTEIALWDGHRLHVTAVPGGPAFEGVGLRNGMAAEAGAICGVRRAGGFGSAYALETIGGAAALGYCGAGLVGAVAMLVDDGVVKPSGRFANAPGESGCCLDPANPRTALFSRDIDAFQRAKAATAAAMAALLNRAGMDWTALQRLCVCGAFGHQLNVAHAQAVGLLPEVDAARVELFADASLGGCELALLAAEGPVLLDVLNSSIDAINLSLLQGYDESYIEHLRLRPIAGRS